MSDKPQQIERVLILTLILNLFVAILKIAIGNIFAILAITTDGYHSLTDATGNIAGLVGNRFSHRPPDANHPYGHKRIETLTAMFIGMFLILTAIEILNKLAASILSPTQPQIEPVIFVLMALTLVINLGVSTYQKREGQRLNSQILIADSYNTRVDVYITLSVILSTFLAALTGFYWLDWIASLIVLCLILYAAWQVIATTGRVLVDTAPLVEAEVMALIDELPQVESVRRVRSRGTEDSIQVDVDVIVEPLMTTVQTEALTQQIEQQLHAQFEGINEIEVHYSPDNQKPYDLKSIVNISATRLNLQAHEIHLHIHPDYTLLELHVEVESQLTLTKAHKLVHAFETLLAAELPHVDEIVTHIEPLAVDRPARFQSPEIKKIPIQQIESFLLTLEPEIGWHNILLHQIPHGYSMTAHAVMDPQLEIEKTHLMIENVETRLKNHFPELIRVTIHAEPDDHD
ncbi:hypothetical protein MASR2M15_03420 [Anaerolineales bacterium]